MIEEARLIRQDLQHGSGDLLRNRRTVAALSIFSSVVLGGIALYQIGVVKEIPQPRWPHFDAEKVNGSIEAYSIAGTPDAMLGMASYAVTACLAGMGSRNRWETAPWIPLAMFVKTIADASIAGKLSVEQWTRYRAFSLWSLLTSAATFASLRYAFPEALKALCTVVVI